LKVLNGRTGEDSGRLNSREAVLRPSQGGKEDNCLVKGEDFATSERERERERQRERERERERERRREGGGSEIDKQYKCTWCAKMALLATPETFHSCFLN
jgi:hypothetical protein